MSISTPVAAGSYFTAQIPTPPGPPANLGARIELPVDQAIVSQWQPALYGTEQTTVVLEAPVTPGLYLVHWMTSDAVSAYDAYVPLQVLGAADIQPIGVVWPYMQPEDVRPDVSDVGVLEMTRTVDEETGEELGTFTTTTRPTAAQVEGLIDEGTDDVMSEIPHDAQIDPRHYRKVKRIIAMYVAMLIEGSFYREQSQDRGGPLWQTEYREALTNLQNRIEEDYAQNNLLGTMEPHTGRLLA